jgi:subtilisin-like proprotein convertase family protein
MNKKMRWPLIAAMFGALVPMVWNFTPLTSGQRSKDVNISNPRLQTRVGLENYDIRLDDSQEAKTLLGTIKAKSARSEGALQSVRTQTRAGESDLRKRVPALKVEYSPELHTPEVIGIDPLVHAFLAQPAGAGAGRKNADFVRQFVRDNNALFSLTLSQVTDLTVRADYTNPDGNLSFVILGQEINGIPVFRGEVEAMITQKGEIVRVINNLAPGLDYQNLQVSGGRAEDAVIAAARYINRQATAADLKVMSSKNDGKETEFQQGQFDSPTKAEMMYFPTEPGVATLAWRVLLWEPVNAYYVIVDAATGKMLWRKNISNDQTQSATYNVYNDDSPGPLSPTNALPGSGIQGAAISRTSLTLISELPAFDNLGWIPDGGNVTTGNNVDAGLDIDGTNGIDPAGRAIGSPSRVFNFAYDPFATAPSDANYRRGAVTNIFFWTNRYHDLLYQSGFTEPARNFQNDNFGRGGLAADYVRAEAQDSSGTENANFATPADGSLPRMQMYIFTPPNPDRDGDLDCDISLHEMTHGTSNRLIGNGSGLTNTQGGGMGEGWSDFYARAILATAGEDVNGIYASGAFATLQLGTLGTNNYYYGIRRFPYAVKTNVGSNGKPHNPLTFADIDPAQINTSDGAFPESPLNFSGNGADEVHNEGEVWCMMLLEVRARFITRLGFAAGNQRALQLVTDAMKVTPLSPSFIQARDAIIAADNSGFGGADLTDIWAGFATRGLGLDATNPSGNAVVESFLVPQLYVQTVTFTDSGGNGNGFADPGENLVLTVPLKNRAATTATSATATIAGNTANYGDIAPGATVSRTIPYTVPPATPCNSQLGVSVDVNSSLGFFSPTQTFTLSVGQNQTFSNAGAITINDAAPATPYPSNITVSGAPTTITNVTVKLNGFSHTFPSDVDVLLVSPTGRKMIIFSDAGSSIDASNANITLNDAASSALPELTAILTGTYRPANYSIVQDAFAAPAPAGPYLTAAPGGTDTLTSAFTGAPGGNPNGTWSLYVVDDLGGDVGSFAGGWSLTLFNTTYTCTVASTLRIDSVSPQAGRTSGNQSITLTGAFSGLSTVKMGGVNAAWSGNTSTITVTTPAHAAGAVQIDLTPTSGPVYSKPNAFAYLPTVFTDDTLVVGTTTAKAQHIIELRQAVDAMRAVAGIGPAPWTDATLTPTSTIIKAVHIQELRTFLDSAASLLGYSTSPYTDPALTTGFVIKRVHIEELRQRIRAIAG